VTQKYASHLANNSDWTCCQICKLYVPNKKTLQHQLLKHSGTNAPGFYQQQECKFCYQILNNSPLYYDHAHKNHKLALAESNWSTCNICKAHFPEIYYLSYHKTACGGAVLVMPGKEDAIKSGSCSFCPRTFLQNGAYFAHLNKEHKNELVAANWIPCPSCNGTLFKNKLALSRHKRYCKGAQDSGQKVSKSKRLQCAYCEKVLTKEQAFYNHNNRCHAEEIANIWPACTICNARYPTDAILKCHVSKKLCSGFKKSNNYQCQFCSYSTTCLKSFYKHCQKNHSSQIEKSWHRCGNCHQLRPSSINEAHEAKCISKGLKARIKASISCCFCSQEFLKLVHYMRHANQSHPKEIANQGSWSQCDRCENYIPDMWSMQKHAQSCKGK
jgi:hypothetical protein